MATKQQNIDEARWRMLMEQAGLASICVLAPEEAAYIRLVELGELTRLACKFKREKD